MDERWWTGGWRSVGRSGWLWSRSDRRAAASPRACRVRGRRPAEREKQGAPVSGGPPGGRVEYPCPCPPCRSVRPVHRSIPPSCRRLSWDLLLSLDAAASLPCDQAWIRGPWTRARPRGRRRPSRPRGRGRRAIPAGPPDGRQFQDRSAKGTPRDGQRELRGCHGDNRPTMRRTPLRTSQGLPQLHKLPRRPNSKVTASG